MFGQSIGKATSCILIQTEPVSYSTASSGRIPFTSGITSLKVSLKSSHTVRNRAAMMERTAMGVPQNMAPSMPAPGGPAGWRLIAMVTIRYLWETVARTKTEGQALSITATFPLHSIPLT